MNPLLTVNDLTVAFSTYAGIIHAVNHIRFSVYPGEAVGIVGESGCGKSVTARSLLGLTNPTDLTGKIEFDGINLPEAAKKDWQKIRGNQISMIFQDPMTALNPVLTIETQLIEPLIFHHHLDHKQARAQAIAMLKRVGIPAAEQRLASYPHEFSGGMRQRVMIAMALICQPRLLLADEPTTALDVTIQAQILDLLKELQSELHTAILFISHDLGAVGELCGRILVMYAGKIVEAGPTAVIFTEPRHPYTRGLIQSLPRLDGPQKKELYTIDGQPPNLAKLPSGCPFTPRCPYAMNICREQAPPETKLDPTHQLFCWLTHPLAPKIEWEALH